MEWLKEHWFKVGILISVLLVILFANNYLQQKNRLAEQKADQERLEGILQGEQKDKEFDADQKEACLAIYKQESSKWNNTNGWRYDEESDTCFIEYKEGSPKTDAQCDADYKDEDGKVLPGLIRFWIQCKEGLFEKSF